MVDTTASLAPGHLDQLRRTCGEVVTPDDDTYDEARRLWNAIHDRRPAVIVRPTTSEQVAMAIRFAREHDLEIVVKSGGHSAAGLKGADGCLVVDLSEMRGVVVDPRTRIARSNGGALLGELDVAAQAHGLVCPTGVVGHTGVAGLTLGGGVGRLQRNFGLTIDNLAAVEIATADGRLVRATATDEPELFWGLRGAGWNFGIATAFEFRLHPFGPDLHRGVLSFPATQIQDVWTVFRDYAASAPDTVSVIFGIDRAGPDAGYPDDLVGRPITYLAWNHSGSAEDVERDTAGLRVGPTPVTTSIGSAPYLDVQTAHDLAFAWGSRSFIKSHNGNDVRRAGPRRTGRARGDRAGGGDLLGHRPGRSDRPHPRGRDGVRRPRRRASTSARTRTGPTRRSTRRAPTGAGGRSPWSSRTLPSAATRTATATPARRNPAGCTATPSWSASQR